MKKIYFASCITICSLYAAQPIQPVFQSEFQLSNLQAILFTTLMMAPLGFAPLFYGCLLESFSAKVMVRWALFSLGVLELLFYSISIRKFIKLFKHQSHLTVNTFCNS
jgi:YNFM family putative membrane transporter